MECVRKTYVTFEFSPVFISQSKDRETCIVDEDGNICLQPGTLDRVLEQYEEVRVPNSRDLSKLKVPKGALHFYFYDRLVATVYENGESIEMRSDELNWSPRYYLETEGELVTREGLKKGGSFDPLTSKSLLKEMDENNCDRIFQVADMDFFLESKDIILKPDQVKMIDTEIPWPTY